MRLTCGTRRCLSARPLQALVRASIAGVELPMLDELSNREPDVARDAAQEGG